MTPDQPQAKKRKLVGFYIAVFMVLGLAIAGFLLYPILKLRYALHRVSQTESYYDFRSSIADEWLMCCAHAAAKGNRRAMEAILEWYYVGEMYPLEPQPPSFGLRSLTSVGHIAARGAPTLFLEVLNDRPDKKAFDVLRDVASMMRGGRAITPGDDFTAKLVADLQDGTSAKDPRDRRLAREMLDYVTRRYARQLAEDKSRKAKDGQ